MKKYKIFACGILLCLPSLWGCDKNPIEEEQYVKMIYMIGASSKVLSFDIPYSETPEQAYVSVACSGTLLPDRDVKVKLGHSDQTLDWYNKKYMPDELVQYRILDQSLYSLPSSEVTLPAGEPYVRMPFTVNTKELHPDSLYALTFKIESVSEYEKHPVDTVLIFNFNLINDYSGTYQMEAIHGEVAIEDGKEVVLNPGTVRLVRRLRAVDSQNVRLFNDKHNDEKSSYKTREEYFNAIRDHGVLFNGTTGQITAEADLEIVKGNCEYEDGAFTFSYDYKSGNKTYRYYGTLKQ